MKHEAALIAVIVAGVGAVAAAIAVGASVREPTVVANPYEVGLHHRDAASGAPPAPASRPCDLAAGPCEAAAGPWTVRLELGPRPLRTMAELAASVTVRRAGAADGAASVSLAFDMRAMSMGPNRPVLVAAGQGRYEGKAVLVRCPSGRKGWFATVAVEAPGVPPASARFDFDVAE